MPEIQLVYLPEYDEIGHIVEDNGNWSRVEFNHRGMFYSIEMSDDQFLPVETIQVELEPVDE